VTAAALSLGSNLPPREQWIDTGLGTLTHLGVHIVAASPRWHTRAVGGPPQPDYLDLVVRAEADLAPEGWLAAAQGAEAAAGRRRWLRWGPRTLDVDVLAIGDLRIDSPALTLPHPAILDRPYLLCGLALVVPTWRHPGCHRTYAELAGDPAVRARASPAAGSGDASAS